MGEIVEPNASSRPKIRIPADILDAFSDLAVKGASKKPRCAVVILQHVEKRLKVEGIDSYDVNYIIKRLVNGLSSERATAHHGFYITLQAILRVYPSVTCLVYKYFKEIYSVQARGKEEVRGFAIGELLLYGALIRADRLELGQGDAVLDRLIFLQKYKSYTEILATQFIVDYLTLSDSAEIFSLVIKKMAPTFSANMEEIKPCELWLRIVFSLSGYANYPQYQGYSWLHSTLNQDNLAALSKIFIRTEDSIPNVHPLVNALALALSREESVLVKFWNYEITPYFRGASSRRLTLLLTFAQFIVPNLSHRESVKAVLGPDMFTLILKSIPRKDDGVGSAAKKLVCSIETLFSANKGKENEVQLEILASLTSIHGGVRFDLLSGMKLQQHLYQNASLSTVKSFAVLLCKGIQYEHNDVPSEKGQILLALKDKVAAALWLSRFVWHPLALGPKEDAWRVEQACVLLKFAYFRSKSHPNNIDRQAKDAFHRCLDMHVRNTEGMINLLSSLVSYIKSLLDRDSFVCGFNPELIQRMSDILAQVSIVRTSEKTDRMLSQIFLILYYHMALHMFEDYEGAVEIISELNACFENAQNPVKEAGTGVVYVDVVVDLLISLLSKGSSYWRSVTHSIFKLLLPSLTVKALHAVTDVLDLEKERQLVSRFRKNRDSEDEETDEDEEKKPDDDDDGGDQDTAKEDKRSNLREGGESDEDMDSEANDDDDEEEEEEEEEDAESGDDDAKMTDDKKLKLLDLKKKMHLLVASGDDVDIDTMAPKEMARLDKELGSLIGQYLQLKNPKASKTRRMTETAIMHFRLRVCDLLDIFMKNPPSKQMALEVVDSLVKCFQATNKNPNQKQLQMKVVSLLKTFGSTKRTDEEDLADISDLNTSLNYLMNLASKLSYTYSPVLGPVCAVICHWSLENQGEGNPVVDIVSGHLDTYFTKKDCQSTVSLFASLLRIKNEHLWLALYKNLLKYAFDLKMRLFKRSRAIEMLQIGYSCEFSVGVLPGKTLKKFESDVSDGVVKVLTEMQSTTVVKGIHLNVLLNLLLSIKKRRTKSGIDWSQVTDVLLKFYHSVPARYYVKAKGSLHSLLTALNVKTSSEAWTESDSQNKSKTPVVTTKEEESPGPLLSKQMKRKHSEKVKSKYKARRIRSESDFKELLDFSFCSYGNVFSSKKTEVSPDIPAGCTPPRKKRKVKPSSAVDPEEIVI